MTEYVFCVLLCSCMSCGKLVPVMNVHTIMNADSVSVKLSNVVMPLHSSSCIKWHHSSSKKVSGAAWSDGKANRKVVMPKFHMHSLHLDILLAPTCSASWHSACFYYKFDEHARDIEYIIECKFAEIFYKTWFIQNSCHHSTVNLHVYFYLWHNFLCVSVM